MRDYVREYTIGDYLVRVLVHEWLRGEVRELSSHEGHICHMFVLQGRFQEYIEHLSGANIHRYRHTGGVYQSDDSIGDNALRALIPSISLEVTVQYLSSFQLVINETHRGIDFDSLSSDLDDFNFHSSDDSMCSLGTDDAHDSSGGFF